MAIDTTEVTISNFSSDSEVEVEPTPSVEQLQDALETCLNFVDELKAKNKTHRNEIKFLNSKIDSLEKEKKNSVESSSNDFQQENFLLKQKIEEMTKVISKFTQGEKNLDLILGT